MHEHAVSAAHRQYAALHSIFAAGVHELTRQVSIACIERGELLWSLWASADALKARFVAKKERNVAAMEAELVALRARQAAADERCARMDQAEAQPANWPEAEAFLARVVLLEEEPAAAQ